MTFSTFYVTDMEQDGSRSTPLFRDEALVSLERPPHSVGLYVTNKVSFRAPVLCSRIPMGFDKVVGKILNHILQLLHVRERERGERERERGILLQSLVR